METEWTLVKSLQRLDMTQAGGTGDRREPDPVMQAPEAASQGSGEL